MSADGRLIGRSNAQPKSPLIAALVEARLAQGLTLRELSKRTGYGLNSFVLWEHERVSPKLQSVNDWAQALGCKLLVQRGE